jgi:hypothetical protein
MQKRELQKRFGRKSELGGRALLRPEFGPVLLNILAEFLAASFEKKEKIYVRGNRQRDAQGEQNEDERVAPTQREIENEGAARQHQYAVQVEPIAGVWSAGRPDF